jgi:hypothetical protein
MALSCLTKLGKYAHKINNLQYLSTLYRFSSISYSNERVTKLVARQLGRISCMIAGAASRQVSVIQHELIGLADVDDETYVEWPFFCEKCDINVANEATKDTYADRVDAKLQLYNPAAALIKERVEHRGINALSNHFMAYLSYMAHFRFLLTEVYPSEVRVAYIHSVRRYLRHNLLNSPNDATTALLDTCIEHSEGPQREVREAIR